MVVPEIMTSIDSFIFMAENYFVKEETISGLFKMVRFEQLRQIKEKYFQHLKKKKTLTFEKCNFFSRKIYIFAGGEKKF